MIPEVEAMITRHDTRDATVLHTNLESSRCVCSGVVARPPSTGNACVTCGGIMVQTGTCHTCTECGNTGGCG